MKTHILSEMSKQAKSGKLSTQIAISSFFGGTLLAVSYSLFPSTELFLLAYFFGLLALIVNSSVLINLGYYFITEPHHREYFAIKILLVVANVPIAAIYAFLLFIN